MSTVNERQTQVSYEPKILCSLAAIKKVFCVRESTIKAWISDGAPIVVENEGKRKRYSTEALRLQVWREKRK